jgi:hypothetical protein
VILDHLADVHAVDVVRPENHYHVRIGLLDEVHVLVDRICGALVPGLGRRTHLGRHGNYELLPQQPGELPAVAKVLQQRLALELNQYIN